MGAVIQDLIGTHMSLYTVKKILSSMYDREKATTMLKELVLQTNTNECKHYGLELLLMNGFEKEFMLLVEKNKQSLLPEDQQWGNMYELYYFFLKNKRTPGETVLALKDSHPASRELQCFSKVIEIYCYYNMKRYSMFAQLAEELTELLDNLPPSILRDFYYLRQKEIMFRYHWRLNELIIARKYAFKVIHSDLTDFRVCRTHIGLGLTYLFEGYDKAIYHMGEAHKIATQYNLKIYLNQIETHNLPFISAHYGYTNGIYTKDVAEQAHLAIAKGNREEAVSLLASFPELTPFQMYYLGVAKEDKSLLVDAYKRFVNEHGNYFYARLPLHAINKMNMG